jgi:hypothetical protein
VVVVTTGKKEIMKRYSIGIIAAVLSFASIAQAGVWQLHSVRLDGDNLYAFGGVRPGWVMTKNCNKLIIFGEDAQLNTTNKKILFASGGLCTVVDVTFKD